MKRSLMTPRERERQDEARELDLLRRRVLVALACEPEGATVSELRRRIRIDGELTSAQVTGALRFFGAAGLAWKTLAQHEGNDDRTFGARTTRQAAVNSAERHAREFHNG